MPTNSFLSPCIFFLLFLSSTHRPSHINTTRHPKSAMVDLGNRERGLKAAIKNSRVSEQAKQRDREILENEYCESADPEYIPAGAEAITEEVPTKTMSTSKIPPLHTMPESEAMMPESTSPMPKKSITSDTTSAYSAKMSMPESTPTMPQSSTTTKMPSTGGSNTTSDYSANKAMAGARTAAPPSRSAMMLPEETENKNPGNV